MNIWNKLNIFKPSEEEILENKKAGRVYVADFINSKGKYMSVVLDDKTAPYDISLRISSRIEVRITYIANDEKITGVQISKLSRGKIEKINLSTLSFEGILGVLHIFSELDLRSITNKSIILDSNIIQNEDELRVHLNTILTDEKGLKIIAELATSRGLIAEGDIGNLKKKKEALELFKNLLYDDAFFQEKKKEWSKVRDEDIWQYFFENNKWIFGYGLNYIFNESLTGKKLEQIIQGANVVQSGKRTDGLLKSRGILNSLCLVEIKTHKIKLLKQVATPYRADSWQISDDLNGGVVQSQKTIQKTIENIKLSPIVKPSNKSGDPTGEVIFSYQPKSYLIIGNLAEFQAEHGINHEKFSSFELFRKNVLSPEIITFDELYERTKFIVYHNEQSLVE